MDKTKNLAQTSFMISMISVGFLVISPFIVIALYFLIFYFVYYIQVLLLVPPFLNEMFDGFFINYIIVCMIVLTWLLIVLYGLILGIRAIKARGYLAYAIIGVVLNGIIGLCLISFYFLSIKELEMKGAGPVQNILLVLIPLIVLAIGVIIKKRIHKAFLNGLVTKVLLNGLMIYFAYMTGLEFLFGNSDTYYHEEYMTRSAIVLILLIVIRIIYGVVMRKRDS